MKLFTIPPLLILYPSFSNASATIATVASPNLCRRTIFVVVVLRVVGGVGGAGAVGRYR